MGRALKRWLVLTLGLAVAATALYVLAGGGSGGGTAPPLDEIDEASKQRLDRVLREEERRRAGVR
jgi:hypothetical protein